MKFRGGEFSTGTKGNFQSELTYFSKIRLVKISEESTCPRKAAVSTASALFSVLPTVHNKPSAGVREDRTRSLSRRKCAWAL